MKFFILIISILYLVGSADSQTLSQIRFYKIKKIYSYDKSYENDTIKYDTTVETFDISGYTILHYTTLLLKDTNSYHYSFDSLGRVVECKQGLEKGGFKSLYSVEYKPEGGYYRIFSKGEIFEERREYNKQDVLVSLFSDLDKHKTIFVLDSFDNYVQEIDIYKDGRDRVIKFKLSYDRSNRLVKRSQEKPDGSEYFFQYNEKGLPIESIFYSNKTNKSKKTIRTKLYEFY